MYSTVLGCYYSTVQQLLLYPYVSYSFFYESSIVHTNQSSVSCSTPSTVALRFDVSLLDYCGQVPLSPLAHVCSVLCLTYPPTTDDHNIPNSNALSTRSRGFHSPSPFLPLRSPTPSPTLRIAIPSSVGESDNISNVDYQRSYCMDHVTSCTD